MRGWPAINRFKPPHCSLGRFAPFCLVSVPRRNLSFPLVYVLLAYICFVCLLYECNRSVVLVEILTFWSFLKLALFINRQLKIRYATPLLARWMCTCHGTSATSVRYKVGYSDGMVFLTIAS